MHLIQASLRWVNYKDRERIAGLLRPIYNTPTEAAAKDALDALADSDFGREYPGVIRRWRKSREPIIPFFDFAPGVRKVIYTMNMTENINGAAAQERPQPRALPLRGSTDQGPLPRLQGDGTHHRPHQRRTRQRQIEDSPRPVRRHVPRLARPGLN